MTRNTSPAVMAQRHEPHDSLDFFPTPPWATRAVCEWLLRQTMINEDMKAWDPCCGRGHMARPMREYFGSVRASDVADYGAGDIEDFLLPRTVSNGEDWIFLNPPFRLGQEFIQKALSLPVRGVMAIARLSFLEGAKRHEELFSKVPPTAILQFTTRVIMVKGICRDPAQRYWDGTANNGDGTWRKPSTATAYCAIIWDRDKRWKTRFDWIPPCRQELEREGDYDPSEQRPCEQFGMFGDAA